MFKPPAFKLLALATLLSLSTPVFAAESMIIDNNHTQVQFGYNHFGFSNIVGRFDKIEGEFLLDAEDLSKSSIQITIPIASISTGVADLDEHLRSPDFFDEAKFPTATFKSAQVEVVAEGKLKVSGELSIHGVSKPVQLDVSVNKLGPHPFSPVGAGFDAHLVLKRSEFGLDKYVPNVSDEITVRITMEARQPKPEAAPAAP